MNKKDIVRAIAAIFAGLLCLCITLAFMGVANIWGMLFCAIMTVMGDTTIIAVTILLVKEVTTNMD